MSNQNRNCEYCGSGKHTGSKCNIYLKVKLMEEGVPPEDLFDFVAVVDSLEQAAEVPEDIRRIQRMNK